MSLRCTVGACYESNMTRPIQLAATLLLLVAACADDVDSADAGLTPDTGLTADTGPTADATGADATGADQGPVKILFGGARPVELKVPTGYDATHAYPLVILLHGYGSFGFVQASYFGYTKLVQPEQLLLAAPNGTVDDKGQLFWNATDACCDFKGSGVDDAGYLSGLIKEIRAVYNVDPRRIYVIGHSNGGFMSYRMACDHAGTVAAIISLAGATHVNPADCKPARTVSVLQIHGDADTTVRYDGKPTSILSKPYPGAEQTMAAWAGYNGCGAQRQLMPPVLDLDLAVAGAETTVERYPNCPAGIDVELWKMKGSAHIPQLTPEFAKQTWAFLKSHPQPK